MVKLFRPGYRTTTVGETTDQLVLCGTVVVTAVCRPGHRVHLAPPTTGLRHLLGYAVSPPSDQAAQGLPEGLAEGAVEEDVERVAGVEHGVTDVVRHVAQVGGQNREVKRRRQVSEHGDQSKWYLGGII
jgi:hypothetical protein